MLDFIVDNILCVASFIFAIFVIVYCIFVKKNIFLIVLSLINFVIIFALLMLTSHAEILHSVFSVKIEAALLYYSQSLSKVYCSCVLLNSVIYLLVGKTKVTSLENQYSTFIGALEHNKWNIYYMCDKRDRIVEMSDGLLQELNLTLQDVLGRKAFDVFDEKIRFTMVNDIETNNNELRDYYKNYKEVLPEGLELKKEYYVKNYLGQTVVFNLLEQGIYKNGKYQGRIVVGQKKNDEVISRAESNLKESASDLEAIKSKFIASLELSKEAIFFLDYQTNSVWGNDNWKKALALAKNDIGVVDYKGFIAKEDLDFYNQKISQLTKDSPNYEIRYKFKVGPYYRFVFERGKKLFLPDGETIIGYISVNSGNFFEYTGYKEIDELCPLENLSVDVNELFTQNKMFELVCISLTNIPEINKKYGRQTGNLIMAEYLKTLKQNFLTESSKIYRASGLIFYVTLTDVRKMQFLESCLRQNGNAMNLNLDFGANKVSLNVNLGIVDSFSDGTNKDELIKNCNVCINTAINPNYHSNFVYYKDIKDYL